MEMGSDARVKLHTMRRSVHRLSKKKILEMEKYERIEWLSAGFVNHKIDLDALKSVKDNFERIGMVP